MNELNTDISEGSVTFFAESVYLENKDDASADEHLEITITPDLHDSDGAGCMQTVTETLHNYEIKFEPTSLDDAGLSFSNMPDYGITASTSTDPQLQCRYCQKIFTSRHYHKKHMTSGACIRDVRSPRIMCRKCGKKFRDPRDLVRHDNFHRVKEKILATPHMYLTD